MMLTVQNCSQVPKIEERQCPDTKKAVDNMTCMDIKQFVSKGVSIFIDNSKSNKI